MKNNGIAMVTVCQPKTVTHKQSIDLEVVVSYGGKSFLAQLDHYEAIELATKIMIEVCRRNAV